MSVATLTPTTTSRTASDLAALAQAAVTNDYFATTGVELLYVHNGDGSDHTLTVTPGATVDGQSIATKTYTITAGKGYLIGPFPKSIWADATGNVALTYSALTSMTVAVIKPGT